MVAAAPAGFLVSGTRFRFKGWWLRVVGLGTKRLGGDLSLRVQGLGCVWGWEVAIRMVLEASGM